MDAAAAVHADLGLQRRAARLRLRGAAHGPLVLAQGFGEGDRHRAAQVRVGLGPVEGHAEMGAAGATAQARMRHTRSGAIGA